MKIIYSLPFLLILFSSHLFAQEYTAEIIQTSETSSKILAKNLHSTPEEELIMIKRIDTDECDGCSGIMRTTKEGEIIWETTIDSIYSGSDNLIINNNGEIVLAGNVISYQSGEGEITNKIGINTYSLSGDLINTYEHQLEYEREILIEIRETTQGFCLVTEIRKQSTGVESDRGHIIHFMDDYTVLWDREYEGFADNDMVIIDFKQQADGTFIATGREGNWQHIQYIMKLDAAGNMLWRDYDTRQLRYDAGRHYQIEDEFFLIGTEDDGFEFLDSLNEYDWAWPYRISRFNSDGFLQERHFLWRYGRRQSSFNYVTEAGDVIIGGTGDDFRDEHEEAMNTWGCAWIIKLDVEFNILWERMICDLRTDAQEKIGSVVEHADKSISALGSTSYIGQESRLYDIYLLHLDEEGCLVPSCGYIQVIDSLGNYSTLTATDDILGNPNNPYTVQLFPNPVKDKVHLELIGEQPRLISLSLVDLQGKILHDYGRREGASIDLDLPTLTSGVYLLQGVTEIGTWTKKVVVD